MTEGDGFIWEGGTKRPATAEEIQRVRETECHRGGHTFDVVTVARSLAPVSVFCSRCGESWAIKESE